jgi:Na+/H+-translocating membrane pyrophosphatase
VISPCMTVVTGTSATEFEVSSGDAAKFADFTDPEVTIHKLNGAAVATVTITDITGTTITVDSIGETPAAGWTARFAGYDDATSEQTETYGYICDDDDYLGTADDECHIITP